MTVERRIETLKQRHAELDRRLGEEQARPMPDNTLLQTLKQEKLALKDEISRLAGGAA